MRSIFVRAARVALAAVAVAACSERATAPHDARAAHIALAPTFTAQSAAIFRTLSTFAATIDNVHIVIQDGTPRTTIVAPYADTVVAFPASASEITVVLDVTLPQRQVPVIATVELREGTTVYFSGTTSFVATQGETSAPSEPVALRYVGPGFAATSLAVTPGALVLSPGGTVQLTATARDAEHATVTTLPITFTTSDATVLGVSSTGLVTSTGKSGTATITAKGMNGLTSSVTLTVDAAVRLATISGSGQSATVGTALTQTFVVQALSASGAPVVDVPITFIAPTGGSVNPATARTDTTGRASTQITLPVAAGSYTYSAQITGSPNATTSAGATATAGPPAAIALVSGNAQSDTVQASLAPMVFRVTDAQGNVVVGQSVTLSVVSGAAAFANGATTLTLTTDVNGIVSAGLLLGTSPGTVSVSATVTGSSVAAATASATVLPGAAAELLIVTQPPTTVPATVRFSPQPVVQVADRFGNAVALGGRPISAGYVVDCASNPSACGKIRQAPSGGSTRTRSASDTITFGLVGTTTVTTDSRGTARFTDLALNVYTGNYMLRFVDGNQTLPAVQSSSIAVTPGPATSIVAWGVADTTYFSTWSDTLYPSVRVIDPVGNGIAGVVVTWDNLKGSQGQLDSSTSTTDASGLAYAGRWILPPQQGGTFHIVATPDRPLENAPLSLYAVVTLPVIGALPAPLRTPGDRSPFVPNGTVVALAAARGEGEPVRGQRAGG